MDEMSLNVFLLPTKLLFKMFHFWLELEEQYGTAT